MRNLVVRHLIIQNPELSISSISEENFQVDLDCQLNCQLDSNSFKLVELYSDFF